MRKKQNLLGRKFGELVVIAYLGPNVWGTSIWLCFCNCGNLRTIPTSNLSFGHTQSCGCLKRKKLPERMYKSSEHKRNYSKNYYYKNKEKVKVAVKERYKVRVQLFHPLPYFTEERELCLL